MDLSVITWNSGAARIEHFPDVDELFRHCKAGKKQEISWINISGLKNTESIRLLGELFGIHPLTIEDILDTTRQPKIEIFDSYRFISIKTIQQNTDYHKKTEKRKKTRVFRKRKEFENTDEFLFDQIGIIIKKNTLITFQEIEGDPFEGIRNKILKNTGEIRKKGTDYLAYAIMDAIVDGYFLILNHLEEDIENFEDRAAKTSDEKFIGEIQDTKKSLLIIKRAIMPLRENITAIRRQEKFFFTEELKPFLQDLSENLNQTIIIVENYREWLINIMDVNISVLSYQMNKVMKVLAMISTIFIPLTFIAGVYGMNFEFMPELGYKMAYPIVLSCMGLIAVIMTIIFKIRRWF